jgi:hypothetical protein
VTLSFDLTIVDGLADMRGSLMLDRRDFAIGANMNDESSLAFAVKVDIALTARRPSDG